MRVARLRSEWREIGSPPGFESGPPFEYLLVVRKEDLTGFPVGEPARRP